MNTQTFARSPSSTNPSRNTPAVAAPIRHVHRERDFGVGYGNSSGYATQRRYADTSSQPRFKFA